VRAEFAMDYSGRFHRLFLAALVVVPVPRRD